jgi:hypothetical protein
MKWQKFITVTMVGGFLLASALVLPASAQLQDNVPGSFLVFPVYDIRPGTSTQIRICDTNNGPRGGAATNVRLNFVCPGQLPPGDTFCDEFDTDIALTFHGCAVIDVASQLPPCDQGFIIAFAENDNFAPVSYNFLIGSENITTGAVASATNAIAIQSPQARGTVLATPDPDTGLTALTFGGGGADYAPLPSTLFSDFRAVGAVPGGLTDLVLLTLDVTSGAENPKARANINFWNANEVPFSASTEFVCWERRPLQAIDAHFTAAGLGTPTGSLRVVGVPTCPAAGFCPPVPTYNPALLGALIETTPGQTLRTLFHTGTKNTVYIPE